MFVCVCVCVCVCGCLSVCVCILGPVCAVQLCKVSCSGLPWKLRPRALQPPSTSACGSHMETPLFSRSSLTCLSRVVSLETALNNAEKSLFRNASRCTVVYTWLNISMCLSISVTYLDAFTLLGQIEEYGSVSFVEVAQKGGL